MRRFNFALRELSAPDGVILYSIEIVALNPDMALAIAIKQYEDEKSYRRDVEEDFTSSHSGELKCNQVVYLSDDRAKYYGWSSD